jgi:hypothetical protein
MVVMQLHWKLEYLEITRTISGFVVSFKTQKGVVQLFWVGGQQFRGLLANMGDSMVEIPIAKSLWPEDLAN